MDNDKVMDKEEKRGIFLGIIGVLTLIVAIIGASFAYFSVNARSKEDAVTVQAATVQIVYDDGQELNLQELIPSKKSIALETQRRAMAEETYGEEQYYELCKDDNNYTVCGVYDFTLTNNGENAVDVNMTVVPTALGENEHGFQNLKFVFFDISDVPTEHDALVAAAAGGTQNGTQIYEGSIAVSGDPAAYSTFGLLSNDLTAVRSIPGDGTTKKYRMFIWLDALMDGEEEIAQDTEQGAVFKGTVHIDLAGAENKNITGTVEGY